MHIRNAGEIVPGLLPRLWISRHFGRRRIHHATFHRCGKLFFPAVRFGCRPRPFPASATPSGASAAWAATSFPGGLSHRRRNASCAAPIPTSAASPAAAASSSVLCCRAVLRSSRIYVPSRLRPKSQAQSYQSRGPPPRHSRPLRTTRRLRHFCHGRSHRTHPSWASRSTTVPNLPNDYSTADAGRPNPAASPSPTPESTCPSEDAANGRIC